MNMPRSTAIVFLTSAIALSTVARAAARGPDAQPDQQLKKLSLEQLGQIVVTSVTKAPEEVLRTPAAIFVLTHDDIVRSGATSIADALRLVPGVEVARIDSSRNWVVGIRGFGDQYSKSLLVLIDGRSVYTPLFGGVHWSLQDLLIDDVDRIEVIRGPGGTIWGANAENGVVNIIMRPASATQGVLATVTTGNVDQLIAGVRYGGAVGRIGTYRAYVKAFKRGPEWHVDDRDFDRWHMGQGGFRADLTPSTRDKVTVHGDVYGGEIGESVLVASFAPPGHALVDAPADVNGQNVVARWDRHLDGGSALMVQGYWDRTHRLGTDFGETRNTYDVDFLHQLTPVARHAVSWGASVRLSPSDYVQTIDAADFQPHDRGYNLFSGFAQDAISLPRRFTLTGGAKLEHNTYTGFEIEPSASLLWAPAGHHSMWVAFARAVRPPSRIDTDISVEQFAAPAGTLAPIPVFARILGTPDVDAEQLVSFEGGYRALVAPSFYVDVTAYHHRYDDVVTLGAPTVDFPTRQGTTYERVTFPFENLIGGATHGIEVAPSVTLARGVSVRGSYSYFSPDLRLAAGAPHTSISDLLLDGSPHHEVVVQGLMSFRGVDLSPVMRYVSERHATAIPGYAELDLPVNWMLNRSFTLSVVGRDLLHAHHAEWARDPGPTVEIRRSAYVRLTWNR